jgi:hypothetical protein
MDIDFLEKLNELIVQNQINKAIDIAETTLSGLPNTDFHKIIGKDLLHLKDDLKIYIDDFYNKAKDKIDVKAIYSEMNGFTINYDLWYIDMFAYKQCEGLDDTNWLAYFNFAADLMMSISGFEDLQTVYEDYMENEKYKDKALKKACEICEYLIILRLQELFQAVQFTAKNENLAWHAIPIFVTAHDYALIYKTIE